MRRLFFATWVLISSSCLSIPPAETVVFKSERCARIYQDMHEARQERIGVSAALTQMGIASAILLTGGTTGMIVGGLALLGIPVVWFTTETQADMAKEDWKLQNCTEDGQE